LEHAVSVKHALDKRHRPLKSAAWVDTPGYRITRFIYKTIRTGVRQYPKRLRAQRKIAVVADGRGVHGGSRRALNKYHEVFLLAICRVQVVALYYLSAASYYPVQVFNETTLW
jgi:hypothetical protein